MLKKPWKQQKSSAMAATNFSEASINDSTWIPVLKDLLLDCRNRVVVLQCGGKKMRWLKKKILFQHHEVPGSRLQSPITIPSHSWVVYLQNSVDGKLTESELETKVRMPKTCSESTKPQWHTGVHYTHYIQRSSKDSKTPSLKSTSNVFLSCCTPTWFFTDSECWRKEFHASPSVIF